MFSYSTDYLATMPDITVYMNCDTRLAINLRLYDLSEYDEFIFAIKNYDHIDSPCVFLFRAKKLDIDEKGEVIFKIPPEASKRLKPGAFYNFSVLVNAFNTKKETEYRKLTDNGKIIIDYGAHDLLIEPEEQPITGDNLIVTNVRLVSPDTVIESDIDSSITASLKSIS